jgi:O-Antigen ligase
VTQSNGASLAIQPRFRLPIPRIQALSPIRAVHLPWYVKLLLTYLAAITIIGKGPTYLGVPPLYWGEVVMAAGVLLIAPQIKRTDFLRKTQTLTIAIAGFMILGALLTAVSFPRWGMDALRDAAMWYYALFYFIALGLASQRAVADRVWYLLRNFWMLALVWNTADLLSQNTLSHSGPIIPGRGVPLLFNATHEAGQHLALGALIVLCTATLSRRPALRAFLIPVALVGLAVFAANQGRAMRLGIASGALVVMLLCLAPHGMPHFNTRLLKLTVAAIPVLALIAVAMPDRVVKIAHLDRFAEADPSDPEGTAGWRLTWWKRLYAEVMKKNPVFGLGFGESLHVYHPLLAGSQDEFVVRSPHNFNVTVFSRMGIAGLLLWITILGVGIGSLFGRVWRGSMGGQTYTAERRDELTFWILMLVCTVVNGSLGVYMEGPVLGIWFWFALGFASARSFDSGVLFHARMVAPRQLLRQQPAL